MKTIQILFCIFLCIVSKQIQCADDLPYQCINIESPLNVLKILTGQQAYIPPIDINSNTKIDISEALYLLQIQANRIGYEIHKSNDTYFCLKNGITFSSILENEKNINLAIHPDAIPTHYGFLWAVIPYILNNNACSMYFNIENEQINFSFLGTIFHETQSFGSFNLTMHIQVDQNKNISGTMQFQIVTSNDVPDGIPLYLFNIQSSYFHNVLLIDPPDSMGDTGNFSDIQILGQDENSYNFHWIPSNSPDLIKSGLIFMKILGANNLAFGHDTHIKYPNFEISFTSSETIFFNGQYDLMNQSNLNALNVSIAPYILIDPNHVYGIHCRFFSNQ